MNTPESPWITFSHPSPKVTTILLLIAWISCTCFFLLNMWNVLFCICLCSVFFIFFLCSILFVSSIRVVYNCKLFTPILLAYYYTLLLQFILYTFWFFGPCYVACGILDMGPGIEPMPPALGMWNLNHWTVSGVPSQSTVDR